ncbi:DUF922 domain-containing protein [Solitalea lacus]|uniref:DUF922 domain-containing protein n=1 Tax=Solitalea lacus TaxID=2911172 RepID=UPI001EDAD84C|nr:hypothetical protein [Solitalea lacus]UKJ08480.1 hypothetical protein L2B55_04760 [Solitalea lacus]
MLLCSALDGTAQSDVANLKQAVKYYKVEFDERRGENGDTLYYSSHRPLKWTDFKAEPRATSSYSAAAFTGFGYNGKIKLDNDTAIIALVLETYFIKPFSWVRKGAQTDYALAHEQLHFDITYLIVQRLKKRLMATTYDADFDSIIQYQYIQSYRDMNRLQEQYDNETRHGIIKTEQERWERQVIKWLQE